VALAWAGKLPERPVALGLGVQQVQLPPTLTAPGRVTGLLVAQVAFGGPAGSAGVIVGDLLLSLGGSALTSSDALLEALGQHSPGDRVELELARGGQPRTIAIVLAERA
jgi:serine protease Do